MQHEAHQMTEEQRYRSEVKKRLDALAFERDVMAIDAGEYVAAMPYGTDPSAKPEPPKPVDNNRKRERRRRAT